MAIFSPAHHPVCTTSTPNMDFFTEILRYYLHHNIVHQLNPQTWSVVFQSLLIYKLCIVATHFLFFPRAQYTGAWLPIYLCDGDISCMTWSPFMLSLQQNHTSSPVSWWCLGSAALTILGSIQTYNTVSFVATYQHKPHLFNSDLEGEASVGAEVLMIQSPSHQAHGTKETTETNSPPRDTWIISDKAPPPVVLPLWITYLCKVLDQLVNLSTRPSINKVIPNAAGS